MHLRAKIILYINLAICFKRINDIVIAAIICYYAATATLILSATRYYHNQGIIGLHDERELNKFSKNREFL